MSAFFRRVVGAAGWPGWWAVAAIAGLAVRARHLLHNHSYWYDEAYLLLNLFSRSYAEMLGRFEMDQVVPPGFACAERAAYDLLGPAEWAMRLPAFLAGLAALGLMAALGRRVLAPPVAWLPLAFVALSRHALTHAVEVKPYAGDLAVAAAVLLAVAGVAGGAGRWAVGLLLAAAAVGPWVSFPAVFVLAGAGAALITWAAEGDRRRWGLFAVFAGLAGASAAGVWFAHARHQGSPTLHEFWGPKGMGGFPDLTDPLAAAVWPLKAGINVGNYGTRDMGAVLLILAGVGLAAAARRNRPLAAALVVPAALAVAAAYLGKYPLAERTGMFLLPSLWLAAALGIETLIRRYAAAVPAVALLPVVVLASDAVVLAGHLVAPPTYPECREAFARVRAERQPGDMLWASAPEVYRVYYGPADPVYGHLQFPAEWEAAARAAPRVWVVTQFPSDHPSSVELATRLTRAGHARGAVIPFWGVRVERWERVCPESQ